LLISIDNTIPVVIIQHDKEAKHALNTAQLAKQCLSHVTLIKTQTDNIRLPAFVNPESSYLLYPAHDAITLHSPLIDRSVSRADAQINDINLDSKVQGLKTPLNITSPPSCLVVLDGTWRKTQRMLLTSPDLQALKKLQFMTELPSRYRLRKAAEAHMLSTLEAIAHTLAALSSINTTSPDTRPENQEPAIQYHALLRVLDDYMALHTQFVPPQHRRS
jgi:DTW domain-containing protein YfiP